jgi:hypothetical protein
MMSSLNAAVVAVVATSTAWAAHSPDKPNIVMVLTDDEDLLLGGASNRPLPVAADALRNAGATFSNHFVHTPVSPPSKIVLTLHAILLFARRARCAAKAPHAPSRTVGQQ